MGDDETGVGRRFSGQNQKQTEQRIVGQTADVSVPYVKQMIVDVAVPGIVIVCVCARQERREGMGKLSSRCLGCIMKDIHEMVVDTPQERICERTGRLFGILGEVSMHMFNVMFDVGQK